MNISYTIFIMKKLLYVLFLSLSFLFIFSPPAGGLVFAQTTNDFIKLFDSQITINKDTSISIVETIDYETTISKHGIYRYIPIRYNRDNVSYTAKVKNIKIQDEKGRAISYSKITSGGNVELKIGDADITFVGKKTYVISYDVENALQEFEDHDELYWDITGEGWQIPIYQSQATIKSNVAEIVDVVCYSGPFGDNDGLCTSEFSDTQANFIYDKQINYGDNMTVAIAFNSDNLIAFPTETEKMIKKFLDNMLLLIPLLPFVGMFLLWFYKGRDWMFISKNVFLTDENQPKKRRPIFFQHRTPFVYEPLKNLTPGEAGLVIDEKVDNQDVVAEIIDLARKKYLKIEQTEKKKLFGKKTGYMFKKLKEAGSSLPAHQKYLHENIFKTGDEIEMSDLSGTFYTHMEKAKNMIRQSLVSKKVFIANPADRRAGYIVLAVFLIMLMMGLNGVISVILLTPVAYLSTLTFLPMLILAWHMPQKSAVGTNYMLQASGLKQSIARGKWREEVKEKHLFIEEVLPFAIAFGVIKKLAKDMEKLNIEPPKYLDSNTIRNVGMYSFINSFNSQAASSLSYNPSRHSGSSSWSGGGGFSSGGSSGGGGGGGGGGSW
jgi:uncharacterized membrane protein